MTLSGSQGKENDQDLLDSFLAGFSLALSIYRMGAREFETGRPASLRCHVLFFPNSGDSDHPQPVIMKFTVPVNISLGFQKR